MKAGFVVLAVWVLPEKWAEQDSYVAVELQSGPLTTLCVYRNALGAEGTLELYANKTGGSRIVYRREDLTNLYKILRIIDGPL